MEVMHRTMAASDGVFCTGYYGLMHIFDAGTYGLFEFQSTRECGSDGGGEGATGAMSIRGIYFGMHVAGDGVSVGIV